MVNEFPIFVLDIVTIFLFLILFGQTYYIYSLSHKIGIQNSEIAQLREIVYAIYEASKGDDAKAKVEHHKLTPTGK